VDAIIGICKRCGFSIKYGEWFATYRLHFFCATPRDLRLLREKGQKEFVGKQKKPKKNGMGCHFGGKYDGFCLEI